ncbi:ArsA-related P-loop ATPase [Baekduia soli]|uniref:ArsA-related P-loop ATPase n=1 Tax=Baekduia soli TaxID=496014 RepID=UPI0016522CB5|nr:ArsA-related P-loop ATPase [Baekduia soli]
MVVTGKGGTGKTTVAAALARAARERGRTAVLCEIAGSTRATDLVEGTGVDTLAIDPQHALEEWLGRQLPRRLVHVLARSGAFAGFVGAAPGVRELVTITKAWELGEERRWRRDAVPYDTVVLDAPASGHGVGLLRTPRTFADIARIGPIASQARLVDAGLRDPARTALVAVALPAELAVTETLELEARLHDRLGRALDAIVVNGVWPRRMSVGDSDRVAAADGALAAAPRHAVAAAAGRVRVQQSQLARLRRDATAPVLTLPFLFETGLHDEHIRALSTRLAVAA